MNQPRVCMCAPSSFWTFSIRGITCHRWPFASAFSPHVPCFLRSSRRKWQPTPVFLPVESCAQRSLVGCCLWGCTESDTTEATECACVHWRRQWQPTPVFLPGESQGWGSLVGCRLWGRTESDTTEATQQQQQQHIAWRRSFSWLDPTASHS